MGQLPVEIKIDDYWIPQLNVLLIFYLYLTNRAFYNINAGSAKSFSHGDVSMMIGRKFYQIIQAKNGIQWTPKCLPWS